jgi:hypothetical protein
VAGERLEDAVAADLNAHGMGGALDLLGEGITDLAGAAHAVEEYEDAVGVIAARGLDATICIKLFQLGGAVDHQACGANLNHILDRAHAMNVPLEIDMADSDLTSDTLRLLRDAATGHPQTRLTIQRSVAEPARAMVLADETVEGKELIDELHSIDRAGKPHTACVFRRTRSTRDRPCTRELCTCGSGPRRPRRNASTAACRPSARTDSTPRGRSATTDPCGH